MLFNLRSLGKASLIAGFATLAIAGGCLSAPGDDVSEEKTYKLGMLAPLTGDGAAYGVPMQNAARLIVKQWNAAGGIQGKQIEMVYEDGQCDGKSSASAAQKLINTDKVKVIIGGLCSGETLGAAPFAEQAKVLLISPGSSSPKISTAGDYIFRTYPSDLGKGRMVAKIALNKEYKKMGVISEQSDYALGLKDAFVEAYSAGGGEAVVEIFTSDSTDLRTQLVKLKEAKVDALFVNPQTPNKGLLVFQQMKEMKWKLPLFTQDVLANDKDTLTKEKDFVEGMIASDVMVRDTDPAVAKFRADYKAEYQAEPNFEIFADATYDALMMVKEGIEKVGHDAEKLKGYLYGLKDYKGLMGTYSFDTNGDPTVEFSALMVKDGKLVPAPELLTEMKKEEPKAEEKKAEEVKTEVKTEEKTEANTEVKTEVKTEVTTDAAGTVEVKTE